MVESRERSYRSRIKQLEDQIAMLKDQLENERRRRRDYIDRSMAGDRLMSTSFRDTNLSDGLLTR